MDLIDICDRAKCSPDFQAIHDIPDADAALWIAGRLARYGWPVFMPEIESALLADRNRPPVATHAVKMHRTLS